MPAPAALQRPSSLPRYSYQTYSPLPVRQRSASVNLPDIRPMTSLLPAARNAQQPDCMICSTGAPNRSTSVRTRELASAFASLGGPETSADAAEPAARQSHFDSAARTPSNSQLEHSMDGIGSQSQVFSSSVVSGVGSTSSLTVPPEPPGSRSLAPAQADPYSNTCAAEHASAARFPAAISNPVHHSSSRRIRSWDSHELSLRLQAEHLCSGSAYDSDELAGYGPRHQLDRRQVRKSGLMPACFQSADAGPVFMKAHDHS